jgi:hypothetical protein
MDLSAKYLQAKNVRGEGRTALEDVPRTRREYSLLRPIVCTAHELQTKQACKDLLAITTLSSFLSLTLC